MPNHQLAEISIEAHESRLQEYHAAHGYIVISLTDSSLSVGVDLPEDTFYLPHDEALNSYRWEVIGQSNRKEWDAMRNEIGSTYKIAPFPYFCRIRAKAD